MDLLADFLHFGTSVFLLHVGLEQWEVWGVKSAVWSVKEAVGSEKCEVWSVKCGVWSFSLECEERSVKCEVWGLECEGSSEKWEVWSVKCGVWSVECEVSVWSAKSAVWSVKCEVWSVKFEVWSAKSAVWSVECGVWSLKFGVRRVQCEVWSVKTLLRLSLKKSNGCRGKDTVGTGCLWTIGHLCLGNFRRRLARVYVKRYIAQALFFNSTHSTHCPGQLCHQRWGSTPRLRLPQAPQAWQLRGVHGRKSTRVHHHHISWG